ncbi:MAG: hypothetical protein IJC21_07425 [Lentisphaeria bacterium]|nr:hypothetical protein [Lentisphaeria bacterium]
MTAPFEIRGFNMCESLLRHTPEQLARFLDRMGELKFNTLIVQYDYGFRHYQQLIKEKCQKHNIDVTLMVFGPRTFFKLSGCDSKHFALDDDGKPYTPAPECETWPCFSSPEALEHFTAGAEIFLREQAPGWIKRIHMRSGDGTMTCRCAKCRNLMPSVGWHPFIKAFAAKLHELRSDLEAESDIYIGRYDLSVPAQEYESIDCVMYDTFGHHPRIALGDNPNHKSNWIPVNGRDTDEFNCNSLYHFDRLSKWAKRLPGKIYIHDNTMMQALIGMFHHNTPAMLKDLELYRRLGLRGVLFEAYEPGYHNFARHFEVLSKAMLDPEYGRNYRPDRVEKMFANLDLDYSHIDKRTSEELTNILPPQEQEFIRICDAGMTAPTPDSYRKFIDYIIDHADTVDVCYMGMLAAKHGIRVSGTLDFSQAAPESRKMLSYRKLWDYMEELPDHSRAREDVIEILKDLRNNVRSTV